MATKYVSAAGSDANPGTFALPWQTITKVESGFGVLIAAGDTIRLRAGDLFTGTMLYNAVKANVTIESYDPITGLPAPVGQRAGVQVGASTAVGSGGGDGVTLSNIDVSTTQPTSGAGQNSIIANDAGAVCRNWNLKNVLVHGAGGNGIIINNAASTGWTIDSCEISNLGDNGILLNACGGGHVIWRSKIHDVGLFNSAQGRHGIYAHCHDYTIVGNEIYNCPNGQAISMRNNGVGSSGIAYLNYVHDTPHGIYFFSAGDATTGTLKAFANRIVNVTVAGIYVGDTATTYFDTVIANNTIVGLGSAVGIDCSDIVHASSTVKNNIVQGGQYAFFANNAALDVGETITEDNNLYYGQTAASPFKYLSSFYTLAGYRTASGNSAHSLSTNPLLGAAPAYSLTGLSPAINAGTPTVTGLTYANIGHTGNWTALGLDFVGLAPDIGAVEYVLAVPQPSSPKAAYLLEVGWGQGSRGLFTFGVSLFGSSTDLLAADSWSASFLGTYDDVSDDGRSVDITRGRDNDLVTMRAGQIQTGLRDANGLYNPQNSASPLAAYLDSDRPHRVSAIFQGVTYPLAYGFITDIEADMAGRGSCQLTAVDFLDKLDRQSPVIAPLAGNSDDGQIFGAILDWFKWTDPAMRNLRNGDTIAAAWSRADGSRSGLALVSELLDAERGVLFVDKAGAVKYIDRQTRYTSVSTGTIDRALTAFPVGKSNANIINQWTVQRTDMLGNPVGVPQTAGDGASQGRHGPIAQTLTTAFLNSDAQALSLAQFLTMRTATGVSLVYEVPISIADTATFIQVLSRDIGDRVTMTLQPRNMPQFTADFFIESLNHSIQTKGSPRHTCIWRVSAAPATAPFRFGSSLMGGSDVLWY